MPVVKHLWVRMKGESRAHTEECQAAYEFWFPQGGTVCVCPKGIAYDIRPLAKTPLRGLR